MSATRKKIPSLDQLRRRERIDCIIGGFPCQDISRSGIGAGTAGARSGLFRQMVRAIGFLRPRVAVLENVATLRERGLSTVLGELTEIGYDAEWDIVPASALLAAPHHRQRCFIIAHPNGERQHNSEIFSRANIEAAKQTTGQGAGAFAGAVQMFGRTWIEIPKHLRKAHDVPRSMGNEVIGSILHGYGNAVMPAVANWIASLL